MILRPLILMTNDDGIDSPGLHAAIKAVADFGELLILAPSSQQTGAGRSYPTRSDKTIHNTEIPINGKIYPAYKVDASPAQAVTLAVKELAKRPIDLCISGINYGENLGSGVTISGTVGAAIDAACYGIPSLAISLETPAECHLNHSKDIDFTTAAYFASQFVKKTLAKGHPAGVDLLKIDIPATATVQTKWRTASISRQNYYDLAHQSRNGSNGIDNTLEIIRQSAEPGSDVYVFAVEKMVSVVPMTIDLTARVSLGDVNHFFACPEG